MTLSRSKPIKRGGRIKPKKRSASEFQRIYGSKARVEFVKSLPCAVRCAFDGCVGQIENAHTETGGMGRKAGYTKIAPLCSHHHRCYDEHRGIFAGESQRYDMQWVAAETERLWLAHTQRSNDDAA